MHASPDFDLSQDRILARCESHVAGENELAADAPYPPSDLRDADDRGLREPHKRIHQDGEPGRTGILEQAEVPRRIAQIEVGKVELGIRAFEYDDTKARAGFHSSEQLLEAFEQAGADDVDGRIIEHHPPVPGRFFDDAQGRGGFAHGQAVTSCLAITAWAAVRITSSTNLGWESIGTWLLSHS